MNHILALDPEQGILRCECGVSFHELMELLVPLGFFLPVVPGTQFITVGGAIANDIHGKNHHVAGSFGNFVQAFELVRSDGSRRNCSRSENADWFRATIGGLGLTGFITWAQIQLIRIKSPFIEKQSVRFEKLDDFYTLSEQTGEPYTVAWIDCLKKGPQLGRGHFYSGHHSDKPAPAVSAKSKINVPVVLPPGVLNSFAMRAFNFAYYRKIPKTAVRHSEPYRNFFFPLDSIENWNRIYGPAGFLQYQLVVPNSPDGRSVIREILELTSKAGAGTFLAVLKVFGDRPSEGLLSFPRPGLTLALDFPMNEKILALLQRCDDLVFSVGGALYPAKDARMSPQAFSKSFPKLNEFTRYIDPRFSSSFWRRVRGTP